MPSYIRQNNLNMTTVFSKNAILTGCVDYYCLVCENQLRSDEEVILHIGKPIHKKNLEATSFLDKHKDDRVRKVKKGYYCEFCNVFMRTAAKVGPHVAEATHRENKTVKSLRREGNGVLAFDKVFIGENAWHGIIDDTCAVCDAEFDNAQIHKTDPWHALNLVLIDIATGPDSNVYRKIDESTFQCLTCNMVCAQTAIMTHFEDADHKKLYEECCQSTKTNGNEKNNNVEGTPEKVTKAVKEDKTEKSEDKSARKELFKDESKKTENETPKKKSRKSPEKEIKEETNKVPEEKKEDKKPEKDVKVAEIAGKKEDKKTLMKESSLGKTDRDICKAFGAVNNIARDAFGKQWCMLCDWAMDDTTIKNHVESRHHQTMLKMHKERVAKDQNGEVNGEDLNENKSKIVDAASEFQKNDIKLDFVDGGAYCRKCSKNIDFDFDGIKNHIEEHKKKAAKPETVKEVKSFPTGTEQRSSTNLFTSPVHKNDPKPKKEKRESTSRSSSVASTREEDEIDAFAKQHSLTYNIGNSNVFCRLCVTKVPASIKNIKEHVNGTSHKSKLAKTTVKSTVNVPSMVASHAFIDSVITIENMFSKDIVINEKFVVNILSFLMITKNGAKLRCQACEVNVTMSDIDRHKNTPRHERTMNDAMVANLESEFIREIRENLFHCGFCNQLEATWAMMDAHLKSTAHREAKTSASWRMMEYTPMIAQHKMRQRMQLEVFTRLVMGEMFGND